MIRLPAALLALLAGAQAPPTGPQTENHPGGKVKARYTLDAEGRRHQLYLEFYESGRRSLSANYDHGVLDGAYEEHYENGKTRIKKRYKKGKLDGDLLRLTDRGQPVHRITVRKDGVYFYPDFRAPVPVHGRTTDGISKDLSEIDPPALVRPWPVQERFETPNVLSAPYKTGTLKKEYMESALRRLNGYRYLAGLDASVTIDPAYGDSAMHGAVVNAANDEMSHTPSRPKGMDEDFFQKGYKGCSSSNLSWGKGRELRDCIDGYMDDSSPKNIGNVGHRAWCLNPALGKVGFGEAGAYKALWVFDRSNAKPKIPGLIAYPSAGYFPVEYYEDGAAWSVAPQGPSLKLPPKGEMALEVWELDDEYDLGRKLEINHTSVTASAKGMGIAVVFRPVLPARASLPGKRFLVSVSGKEPPRIAYVVEFFSGKP